MKGRRRRPRRRAISRAHVDEYRGEPVTRITKGLDGAATVAGRGRDATRLMLRRTPAPRMIQGRADPWQMTVAERNVASVTGQDFLAAGRSAGR